MTLRRVRAVDYNAPCAYAPMTVEAVINLADISRGVEVDPRQSRSSEPLVRITFTDGKTLDVVGHVRDFAP